MSHCIIAMFYRLSCNEDKILGLSFTKSHPSVFLSGANTGIGKETAVDLARRGARVILACRSKDKAEAAVEEIKQRSGNEDVVFKKLDLSSLASVRTFAQEFLQEESRLDILINNAGKRMMRSLEDTYRRTLSYKKKVV